VGFGPFYKDNLLYLVKFRRKDYGPNVTFLGPSDHGQLNHEKSGLDHLPKTIYLVQSRVMGKLIVHASDIPEIPLSTILRFASESGRFGPNL
jgi:hypothetical protein